MAAFQGSRHLTVDIDPFDLDVFGRGTGDATAEERTSTFTSKKASRLRGRAVEKSKTSKLSREGERSLREVTELPLIDLAEFRHNLGAYLKLLLQVSWDVGEPQLASLGMHTGVPGSTAEASHRPGREIPYDQLLTFDCFSGVYSSC